MGQEISQQNQRHHCTQILNAKNCKQNFQKQKVYKTPSTHSLSTNSSSGYQTTSTTSVKLKPIPLYDQISPQSSTLSHDTGSGLYYSSYYCSSTGRSTSPSITSSALSTASTASSSKLSNKSLDKQKNYLNHHLYIKSYLDIVEEDERAKEHFKPARPGIRNYTPKILADKKRSGGSSSAANGASKSKKDELWI